MATYIIKRLVVLIPLLLGITVISFAVIHLAPGKPAAVEQGFNPRVSQEVRLKLEKLYGLDKPLHVQLPRGSGALSGWISEGRSSTTGRC